MLFINGNCFCEKLLKMGFWVSRRMGGSVEVSYLSFNIYKRLLTTKPTENLSWAHEVNWIKWAAHFRFFAHLNPGQQQVFLSRTNSNCQKLEINIIIFPSLSHNWKANRKKLNLIKVRPLTKGMDTRSMKRIFPS